MLFMCGECTGAHGKGAGDWHHKRRHNTHSTIPLYSPSALVLAALYRQRHFRLVVLRDQVHGVEDGLALCSQMQRGKWIRIGSGSGDSTEWSCTRFSVHSLADPQPAYNPRYTQAQSTHTPTHSHGHALDFQNLVPLPDLLGGRLRALLHTSRSHE